MCSCMYVCTEVFALLLARLEPKRSHRSATAYFTRIARERGEMPVDQQKSILKPIKIVERVVVVSNGVSSRPCTLSIDRICGSDMMTIVRCSKDWCRFLRNQGAWCRPLAGIGLWKLWSDAVLLERQADLSKLVKSRDADECCEACECTDAAVDLHRKVSRRDVRKCHKKRALIKISLPLEPGSEETRTMLVLNNPSKFAFAYEKANLQWLCAYIAKDTVTGKYMNKVSARGKASADMVEG